MTAYYGRHVFKYFSKLDESDDFASAEIARAHDRRTAVLGLAGVAEGALFDALSNGNPKLVAALRFLADEIEEAGRDRPAPEPETA